RSAARADRRNCRSDRSEEFSNRIFRTGPCSVRSTAPLLATEARQRETAGRGAAVYGGPPNARGAKAFRVLADEPQLKDCQTRATNACPSPDALVQAGK